MDDILAKDNDKINDSGNSQNRADSSTVSETVDSAYAQSEYVDRADNTYEQTEYVGMQNYSRAQRKHDSMGGSFFSFLKELPVLVITAVIIAFLLKWLVIQPFYIPSESMEPTLVPNDRVLVSKFLYRFVPPSKNDVVVFVAPKGNGVDFIKRIVAVGGDEIEQKNGVVYVNGKELKGDHEITPGDTFSFPVTKIAKGHIFVMGDNRTNSSDSRVFGPVPESSIVGKAFVLYWPLNRIGILH